MQITRQKPAVAHAPEIASRIITLRGEKVILDADLAWIYGVKTGQLNRAVKRNLDRFPEDFLFRLTAGEAMRCQSGTASRRNVRYLPRAFTEHGALMAANVLSSSRAVEMSVYVIRAFVRIRRELSANETVARQLAEIEKILLKHDGALRDLYEKIRPLLLPPPAKPRREIGFHAIGREEDNEGKAKRK
jgi:ORF6N domain